ncbi:MAG: hypothetical protein KC492_30105, partial [Myxococcales bacterium]|nr:hypothetical protein [Myxococcales bacterium]
QRSTDERISPATMSICGLLELNTATPHETLRAEVRGCGFPSAEVDCQSKAGSGKTCLVDLAAYSRCDAGLAPSVLDDLERVASLVLAHAVDNEVLYTPGFIDFEPAYVVELALHEIRGHPPDMEYADVRYRIRR